MKIISRKDFVIVQKDLKEIWSENGIRVRLILLPVLIAVVLPMTFLLAALLSPETAIGNEYQATLMFLSSDIRDYDVRQRLFFVALDYIMPMMFLLIPIYIGSMTAAVSFAGEKERGTFETLLFSPISPKKLGRIKWLNDVVLTLLITWVCFFLITVISAVGNILLEIRFFIDLSWLITVFLTAPLVSVASVMITVLYSQRCKKQQEAYQINCYLIFPIVLLYVLPFTGLYDITPMVLFVLSILLLAADIFLIKICEKRFKAENLML